jgi:hypothetical protein
MTDMKATGRQMVEKEIFQYFYEEGKDRYRVWKSQWAGDQFEIFTREEFKAIWQFCKSMSIPIVEVID